MELLPLDNIPTSIHRLCASEARLGLNKDIGVKTIEVTDLSLYEKGVFEEKFFDWFSDIKGRNKSRIKRDSLVYSKLLRAVVYAYVSTFISIILNRTILGETIILCGLISFKISDMPTTKKFRSKFKYIYKHRFRGIYPKMRISVSKSAMNEAGKTNSISKKSSHKVLRIDGQMLSKMNAMVAYQIVENGQQYTKSWNTKYVRKNNKIKIK